MTNLAPVRNEKADAVADRFIAAREAQAAWKRYSLSQRVKAVRGVWREILAARGELSRLIHAETGKPSSEIQFMEFDAAGLIVKYFTRNAHRILQDREVGKPWPMINKRAYVRYVPRGAVALITPWNMPFLLPVGDMVPALLAGNAVILKPSEWTTRTALLIEDRVRRSGLLPEGLFQVCVGDGTVGTLVTREADMVLFTGSAESGRRVAYEASKKLIPAVLELGGLHPMLVAADAPLERAAKAALWGRFANSGQLCVGVERVYVERAAYRPFSERLEKLVEGLRQGSGEGFDVDLGRLIHPGQLEVVEGHLRDARDKGARVLGGEVLDREGLLISPALILDATQEMAVMKEETFGPVLPVMPVASMKEGLRYANTGSSGLAASVWTNDLGRGEEWASLIEAGMVSVNDLLSHYALPTLPFGGVKESGLGRRHSEQGLNMFCEQQSVVVHEWPANVPDPWWFPYSRAKARLLAWFSRFS